MSEPFRIDQFIAEVCGVPSESDKWRAALQRCEQQVTERDQKIKELKASFKCFKCGDSSTPLYCLNCGSEAKIARYEEVLRLIYNNSGWLRTEENRWLLQRLEQAVAMIKR